MIKSKDFYTQKTFNSLITAATSPYFMDGEQVGTVVTEYTVNRHVDVTNLQMQVTYVLTCSQRFTIPNNNAFDLDQQVANTFENYPGMVINKIELQDDDAQTFYLVDYTPKTLNTSVSTSSATSDSSTNTTGEQYSSGASNSQSNTFDVSANLGFFGDMLTGGASVGYSSTSTHGTETSQSQSHNFSSDTQSSESASMTIKDWGSYAQISKDRKTPSWIWTQEYPWSILKFNAPLSDHNQQVIRDDTSHKVYLPEFVTSRLTDGYAAYPPSELSLFGIDFISKATWRIIPSPNTIANKTNVISNFTYVTATHALKGSVAPLDIAASINSTGLAPILSGPLDLPLLALDPISASGEKGAAIIGFVPNKFDVNIQNAADTFQITSATNDLLVRGSGFQSIMTADFSTPVVMDVYFKLNDETSDVSLYFKHWVAGADGCVITININDNNIITRHVDTQEGEGGSVKVQKVSLRFRDFTSINYCDYLRLGENHLSITIAPPAGKPSPQYTIHAMAIG